MGGRGVHFAVNAQDEQRLLAAGRGGDHAAVSKIVVELEDAWAQPHLLETDNAWDAIHRCLTDGTLDPDGGSYPLSHAVLGGEQLGDGEDGWVCYVSAEQVDEVAEALSGVTEEWLGERYARLSDTDYDGPDDEDDLAYVQENLTELRAFYELATKEARAVIFTVEH